jgi:hypothetical protein
MAGGRNPGYLKDPASRAKRFYTGKNLKYLQVLARSEKHNSPFAP